MRALGDHPLNMAMIYRGSRLAMAAAKAQQPSRTAMAAAKGTVAAGAAAESTTKESTTKVVKHSGLFKPLSVSPVMKKFLGVSEVTRPEATKKIWEHIKANNLQNPANKREILCDEKLKAILGQKENVDMFEIAKLISPHFIKK